MGKVQNSQVDGLGFFQGEQGVMGKGCGFLGFLNIYSTNTEK